MCERLAEIEDAMRRYAACFDASLLTAEQAGVAIAAAAAIERIAATVKGLAAARVADAGAWKSSGERSAAHALARSTGTSVGQASEALATAKRLEKLPAVGAAARDGRLSASQAAAVADAATADPRAESRLLEKAQRSSLAELREECARTKAAALPDAEARRGAIHSQRFLRSYVDAEGAWNLRMRENPEVGAAIMAAIEPVRDRLFRAARADGRREPSEAYAADALTALTTKGVTGTRSRAKTIVRMDLEALLRGRAVEGEVCEIAGFGPVAVSAVRELLDTGDPFLAAVVTKGEQVVGVAHLGRRPTATHSKPRSSGSTRRARPRVARQAPGWRTTIEWTGRRATSPCSTFSIGSARTTTTSRASTVGPWSTEEASDRLCLRAMCATLATPTLHPGPRHDVTRLSPCRLRR